MRAKLLPTPVYTLQVGGIDFPDFGVEYEWKEGGMTKLRNKEGHYIIISKLETDNTLFQMLETVFDSKITVGDSDVVILKASPAIIQKIKLKTEDTE